jgi:AraC family transcriptional regulator
MSPEMAVSEESNALHSITSKGTADLLQSVEQTLSADQALAKDLINQAIALLRRNPAKAKLRTGPLDGNGGLAPWQVRRVSEFVDEHLGSPLLMAEVATVVGLSGSHFGHVFKRSLGISPYAYVLQKRIARAQELMLATDKPLVQIALNCGLADQSHLCHVFRRLTGYSPAAWRRLHRLGGIRLASPAA